MAFVDELTIEAAAGRGGDGVVRWLHLKGKEYSGPAGGNGGRGGDIYIRGVRDIGLLARYRGEKKFAAHDGGEGESSSRDGRSGEDLSIDLPVGSVVHNGNTGEVFELLEEGQRVMVLRGGRGGAGNAAFKSSINRTPLQSTDGAEGEHATLHIELRLIADAGLVGLPNAGKTSLLNALTGASAKVANYPFTTLDPNLGVLHGLVVADIPGLIEGASGGKGLGHKFLRHIARTRLILHCVSVESQHPEVDWSIVRQELEAFEGGVLKDKREVIILTKSDTRTPREVEHLMDIFKKKGREVVSVSVLIDGEVKALAEELGRLLR
ncbi:MAG: GTPase ObgE [Patescibacteria group bacterium]|nr:GTPase ObgE [Patescibacteria group bacterium]